MLSPTSDEVPPEHAFVTRCARAALDGTTVDRSELLVDRSLDWEYVIDVADHNRVRPLVYRGLEAADEPGVPDDVRRRLREAYQSNARRNLALAGELHRVLRVCTEHGFRVLPFKGPVLTASVYGDLALRSFADLDLLVAPEDVSEVTTVLQEQGYELTGSVRRHGDSVLFGGTGTPPILVEYPLHRPTDGIRTEIRWRIGQFTRPFGAEFETLWRNREPVVVGGQPLDGLSSIDRLLVLAYHGTKHLWTQLKWVCDIAAWVREHPTVSWERVFDRAEQYGVERSVLVALALIETLLQYDLPSDVETRLRGDARARALASDAADGYWSRVTDPTPPIPTDIPLWERTWYNARASDSPRAALTVLWRSYFDVIAPDGRDYNVVPLPPSLYPVYYLVRPVRVAMSRAVDVRADIERTNGSDREHG